MTEIIGVRFKEIGKIYSFSPKGEKYAKDDFVIVETARGLEMGQVLVPNKMVEDESLIEPLKDVIRMATGADHEKVKDNKEKAKEALAICQKKSDEHKLDMKVIDVEISFDNSKILFFFTAEGRVDFRELVRDLASIFRTRIELRQVGVRDEAKLLGGLGICGLSFCCSTFLDDFQPVSIKMAKEQNLSLNPTKISGTCGRLMCCLKYEQDVYEELNRTTPPVDSIVETPEGMGRVVDVNLLRGRLKVQMENSPGVPPKCFEKCECCMKKQGKRRQVEEPIPADIIED